MSKFYLKLLNQTLFSQLIFPMRKHHLQLDRNENNNNIILVFAYIHRNHHRVRELAMRCVSKILRSVRLQFMLPSMCLAQFFFLFVGWAVRQFGPICNVILSLGWSYAPASQRIGPKRHGHKFSRHVSSFTLANCQTNFDRMC